HRRSVNLGLFPGLCNANVWRSDCKSNCRRMDCSYDGTNINRNKKREDEYSRLDSVLDSSCHCYCSRLLPFADGLSFPSISVKCFGRHIGTLLGLKSERSKTYLLLHLSLKQKRRSIFER